VGVRLLYSFCDLDTKQVPEPPSPSHDHETLLSSELTELQSAIEGGGPLHTLRRRAGRWKAYASARAREQLRGVVVIEPQAFDELTRQGGELAVGGIGGQRRELESFEPRRELLASGHALALQDLEAAVLDTVGRGAADRVGRQRSEAW